MKVLFFCFLLSGACGPKNGTAWRSHFWDRVSVHFFEVCCIKVAEAQRFGFNEALWLMAAGRATRKALLSEASFEKVFRTQNWSVGGSCFVDDLVSCWGKRGAYRLPLEPSLKVTFIVSFRLVP